MDKDAKGQDAEGRQARQQPYAGRREAGRALAEALRAWREGTAGGSDRPAATGLTGSELIVLGLPRGGVPVAAAVASALRAPLDVVIVRKLGVPRQPEVAMGALASTGDAVIKVENAGIMRHVRAAGIADAEIDQVEATELAELRRRQAGYRGGLPNLELAGRTVVLVDDGLATGATMRAAIGAVREGGAAQVVVALPVIIGETPREVQEAADALVCPWVAPELPAVGAAYEDFQQTSDDEVRALLRDAASRAGAE